MNLPNHIAIIPDGNRRWAKEKGLPAIAGHKKGAEITLNIARHARKLGIKTLTFWAFSTENWTRTAEEIQGIAGLGDIFFKPYVNEAIRDHVRITHLGRKDRLPGNLKKYMEQAEEKTAHFDEYFLNLAFDYGGRDEVVRAVNKIIEKGSKIKEVTEENFGDFLDTSNSPYPNPDIIIRTSGEMRTSGLMIWQAAYAEYFFLDKYYPDLQPEDLDKIVEEYSNRQRRFGK